MFFNKMKPIENLYKENRIELMNIADLADIPALPVYHILNKPLHLILGNVLGLISFIIGVFGFLSIPLLMAQSPNTAWFLIGVMLGVGGFLTAFQFLGKITSLRHRYTLAIYADKVVFLKHDFKKQFDEIGFDRAYLAEYVGYRHGGKLLLHYIRFSLSDDKLYYKTHRVAIGRFTGYEKHDGGWYAMLLNALIQAYHRKHNLVGKLPRIKFIPQRDI